jgi:hypothetical protein
LDRADFAGIDLAIEERNLQNKTCAVGTSLPSIAGQYLESGAVVGGTELPLAFHPVRFVVQRHRHRAVCGRRPRFSPPAASTYRSP